MHVCILFLLGFPVEVSLICMWQFIVGFCNFDRDFYNYDSNWRANVAHQNDVGENNDTQKVVSWRTMLVMRWSSPSLFDCYEALNYLLGDN
jgi:hypothetical protein